MFTRKSAVAACGMVLGIVIAVASAHAWNPAHQTTLTFSRSVSLPGVTLVAGTYVFEVANPVSSSDVVRVRAKDDYRHVVFMGFTKRIDRPAGMSPNRLVVLGEAAAGMAPPILVWYQEGAGTGRQFIYNR